MCIHVTILVNIETSGSVGGFADRRKIWGGLSVWERDFCFYAIITADYQDMSRQGAKGETRIENKRDWSGGRTIYKIRGGREGG